MANLGDHANNWMFRGSIKNIRIHLEASINGGTPNWMLDDGNNTIQTG
jgi:hypothetical protein